MSIESQLEELFEKYEVVRVDGVKVSSVEEGLEVVDEKLEYYQDIMSDTESSKEKE